MVPDYTHAQWFRDGMGNRGGKRIDVRGRLRRRVRERFSARAGKERSSGGKLGKVGVSRAIEMKRVGSKIREFTGIDVRAHQPILRMGIGLQHVMPDLVRQGSSQNHA